MAKAYFVGLKKKKIYDQYLGNATPLTIRIAKKKLEQQLKMLDCNIHHNLNRNCDRALARIVGQKEEEKYQLYLENATHVIIKNINKAKAQAQNVGLEHPSQYKFNFLQGNSFLEVVCFLLVAIVL